MTRTPPAPHWSESRILAALLSALIALTVPVVGSYWSLQSRVIRLETSVESFQANVREDLRDIKETLKDRPTAFPTYSAAR